MNAPVLSSDTDGAAVMVMLLGEEQAARMLGRLDPGELVRLGESMCALGEIGPAAIARAIEGFVARFDQRAIAAEGRENHVRGLLTRSVGEVKADNLMQRILPQAPPDTSALELARWLNADVLLRLVGEEHPQAIAVLLVQLEPEVAASVLHGLPDAVQGEVVHRIATLGPVAPDVLSMLEDLLTQRIGQCHGSAALRLGGPREVAEIINNAGKAVEKRVLPDVAKRDKQLARAIEQEMFKFEHLYELDPQSMGALLREVESETLIDALKGIAEEEREFFFGAMSSRAADGVRDEIAARGRLKRADVELAQRAIVAAARKLAAEGTIVFGAGGEDDYV